MKQLAIPFLILTLAAGGCAAAEPLTPPPTAIPQPTSTPTPEASSFRIEPVLDTDFPDPDLLRVGDVFYAYATNGNGKNIQAARSADLRKWEVLPDALPKLPGWAAQSFGKVWAPDVSFFKSTSQYVMYYTARFVIEQGGTQCIGVATSQKPEGPFTPVGSRPLICQVSEGGSIDPAVFVDEDGTPYLLWKNDGNSGGGQSWIYLQKLSADGMALQGEAHRLITADQSWEGVLVEGPTLVKHDRRYYLFYSANSYNHPNYATGLATAEQLNGPYVKQAEPFLKTSINQGVVGPGGQDIVFGADSQTWIFYHGWRAGSYRAMYAARVDWIGGLPVIRP